MTRAFTSCNRIQHGSGGSLGLHFRTSCSIWRSAATRRSEWCCVEKSMFHVMSRTCEGHGFSLDPSAIETCFQLVLDGMNRYRLNSRRRLGMIGSSSSGIKGTIGPSSDMAEAKVYLWSSWRGMGC